STAGANVTRARVTAAAESRSIGACANSSRARASKAVFSSRSRYDAIIARVSCGRTRRAITAKPTMPAPIIRAFRSLLVMGQTAPCSVLRAPSEQDREPLPFPCRDGLAHHRAIEARLAQDAV